MRHRPGGALPTDTLTSSRRGGLLPEARSHPGAARPRSPSPPGRTLNHAAEKTPRLGHVPGLLYQLQYPHREARRASYLPLLGEAARLFRALIAPDTLRVTPAKGAIFCIIPGDQAPSGNWAHRGRRGRVLAQRR
jgi:hypothetical protein